MKAIDRERERERVGEEGRAGERGERVDERERAGEGGRDRGRVGEGKRKRESEMVRVKRVGEI